MSDDQLHEVATEFFQRYCGWEIVGAAASSGWSEELWEKFEPTGFNDVAVPEECSGPGGSLADAVGILRAAGAHAAPLPVGEAGLIGGWLIALSGLSLPKGVRTVLPNTSGLRRDGDRLFGVATAVPWGHRAEHVVGLVGGAVIVLPGPSGVGQRPSVSRATNIADEPRDTLRFEGVPLTAVVEAPVDITPDALADRIALARSALMAGALSAVADMSVRYSRERHQFGRPIGQFPAVKAHLVDIHQQARLAVDAVKGAVAAVDRGTGSFEIACAKLVADTAAQRASRAAHQVHGAIGMTREYPLQFLTRRLWAWCGEARGHQHWADRIGQALITAGPDALYPAIQSGIELAR
jgi:acyl-CoA dehydrogenase